MRVIISFVVFLILLSIGLTLVRNYDELVGFRAWKKLENLPNLNKASQFSAGMVEDLPAPARRYFEFMISPGTSLKKVSIIEMEGRLGLGPKESPDYMKMSATQIMALPEGFVWRVKSGRAELVLTGFDGLYENKSWSRFWFMQSIPVGRAGGRSSNQEDHRRASFGRLVAEATFWSPAALLPSENVRWQAQGEDVALVTVTYKGLEQSAEIYLNQTGQPYKVIIARWSDANPEQTYQLQPFGGYLSVFKDFEGFRLPTHIDGGNFIGTEDYFPFYIADVENVTFKN